MSTSSSNPWSSFLSELPASTPSTEMIMNEELFHRRFMQYCDSTQEDDPQRLLARFLRHHDEIIRFVSALDESMELDQTSSLSSVFWSRAFDIVVMALNTKQKYVLVNCYLPQLDGMIPAFGSELSLFADDEIVQKPLQGIFASFMSCYSTILQLLDLQQKDVDVDMFVEQTTESKKAIATLKDEWSELARQAAFDKVAAGTPDKYNNTLHSFYNLTVGPTDPLMTTACFSWQESLGKGTYGEVSRVRETTSGAFYARKTMAVADMRLRERIKEEFLNEVAIMQKLRHQHIASVQLYVLEDDKFSMFMLPAADYDLRRYMRICAESRFPTNDLVQLTTWFGCLISALVFAHSKDIKHEDIKPNNILIKDRVPYLTDFGCAKDFSGLESSASLDSATTGTPVYWPPESQPRGRRADIWALGCVFSEMLTVRQKKAVDDFQQYRFMQYRDNGYAFRESLDKVRSWLDKIVPDQDNVGQLLKEQTLLMLEPEVAKRKEAKEIKKSLRYEGDSTFCNSCL